MQIKMLCTECDETNMYEAVSLSEAITVTCKACDKEFTGTQTYSHKPIKETPITKKS